MGQIRTVKPMKWFDEYFDFFTEKHGEYILGVLNEYTATLPSFKAFSYTQSVVKKISNDLIVPIEKEFINCCADEVSSCPPNKKKIRVLAKLLRKYKAEHGIKNNEVNDLATKTILLADFIEKEDGKCILKIREEIGRTLRPELFGND